MDDIKRNDLGATGKFPDGKLNEHDKGELAFAIGIDHGCVTLIFKDPVEWIGLPPENAIELGEALISKAKQIQEQNNG